MNGKVTELQQLVSGETSIPLCKEIDTALKKFKADGSNNITANYTALAPVFATMAKTLSSNQKDFHAFNASYHKLAANAYNKSLGVLHEQNTFVTNSEMVNNKDNYYVKELGYAGLGYQDVTNSTATTMMTNYLKTIASQNNTSINVLKKVVELALYNESLYGLNDFANECGVNKTTEKQQRSLNTFFSEIQTAFYATQSIDDRTM